MSILRHAAERATELVDQRALDLADISGTELRSHRRHHARFEAARIDAREVRKVCRDVEREAMERDPLAARDAHRAKLLARAVRVAAPHAGLFGLSTRVDAEPRARLDHRFFEVAQEAM